MSEYNLSKSDYESYADFTYTKIDVPSLKSFDINNKSQFYEFPEGKSYFLAFELPKYEKNYEIEITSYLIGDTIRSSYIFLPAIKLLDENFIETRTIDESAFESIKPGFFEVLSETGGILRALKGKFSVERENARDKYMVIHTSKSSLESNMKKSSTKLLPLPIAGSLLIIPIGKEEVRIPYSPSGHVRINTFFHETKTEP